LDRIIRAERGLEINQRGMQMRASEHAMGERRISGENESRQRSSAGLQATVERLPFTVKVVRDEEQLRRAVEIRQAAYARHVPGLAAQLRQPEPDDHDRGCLVLLAESRMDGSPVGTMRIQTNRGRALAVEKSVALPPWLQNVPMAEATRLGIAEGGAGRVVKIVLCKAFYLYCLAAKIEWMVIAARPPVDRQYERALFKDVFPGESFPLRHANNIPHRVLAFEVGTAAARWAAVGHPLSQFMVHTRHPDIDLSGADDSSWSFPAARTAVREEALANA
jgi:hypothetical protein